MNDIEKRARELLDAELRKIGLHEDAYHVGCGAELDRNDQAAINAIIAALSAAAQVPEGWGLAPAEPDSRMLLSGHRNGGNSVSCGDIWRAMFKAKPVLPR